MGHASIDEWSARVIADFLEENWAEFVQRMDDDEQRAEQVISNLRNDG